MHRILQLIPPSPLKTRESVDRREQYARSCTSVWSNALSDQLCDQMYQMHCVIKCIKWIRAGSCPPTATCFIQEHFQKWKPNPSSAASIKPLVLKLLVTFFELNLSKTLHFHQPLPNLNIHKFLFNMILPCTVHSTSLHFPIELVFTRISPTFPRVCFPQLENKSAPKLSEIVSLNLSDFLTLVFTRFFPPPGWSACVIYYFLAPATALVRPYGPRSFRNQPLFGR